MGIPLSTSLDTERQTLRIVVAAQATVVWSADGWARTNRSETGNTNALSLWFVDLATEGLPSGAVVEFTFYWETAQRWEGRNWRVQVEGGEATHV